MLQKQKRQKCSIIIKLTVWSYMLLGKEGRRHDRVWKYRTFSKYWGQQSWNGLKFVILHRCSDIWPYLGQELTKFSWNTSFTYCWLLSTMLFDYQDFLPTMNWRAPDQSPKARWSCPPPNLQSPAALSRCDQYCLTNSTSSDQYWVAKIQTNQLKQPNCGIGQDEGSVWWAVLCSASCNW